MILRLQYVHYEINQPDNVQEDNVDKNPGSHTRHDTTSLYQPQVGTAQVSPI